MYILAMNLDGVFDGIFAIFLALAMGPVAFVFLIKSLLTRRHIRLTLTNAVLSLLWAIPLAFLYLNNSQVWVDHSKTDGLTFCYLLALIVITLLLHFSKAHIKAPKN